MESSPTFSEWAGARQARLVRAAYLMTGDLAHAEDLVQEALVKVCLRWDRLRDGHPEAFARTVISRDHVSWWRRRREHAVPTVPDLGTMPAPAAGVEDAAVVRAALLRLPTRQRAVLVLRFFEDLSVADTAAVLGVSTGTVKSQTYDALRSLRAHAPELAELVGGTHD